MEIKSKLFQAAEKEGSLNSSVFIAVAAVNGVLANGSRIQFADGTLIGFGRIGGTNQFTEIGHGIVFFKNRGYDGSTAHEFHQFAKEGTLFVNGVKFARFFCTQFNLLQGHHAEPGFNDMIEDGAGMAIAHGIRLDHGECTVTHNNVFLRRKGKGFRVANRIRSRIVPGWAPPGGAVRNYGLFPLHLSPFFMQEISRLYPLLEQPKQIVVTMHQKPDPDAMGSALGLYHFLLQLGHQVQVISPTNWAAFLNWMPGCEKVLDYERNTQKCDEIVRKAGWIFCLDFNCLPRTKRMAPMLEQVPAEKILIDHHREPQSEVFAYGVSDTSKSSTAEMIYDLIRMSGHAHLINQDIMQCLYAGVMGDTGSFRFPSTSASVHEMVAHFKLNGLLHTPVHENIYDNFLENRFRFIGHVLLNRMEMNYELNLALIWVTRQDLLRFDIKTGDTEGLVNYPLGIQGIRLAALVIDRDEKRKWSFRSKGDFDCNTFARSHFNGGGHFNAAGGERDESLEFNLKLFREVIQDYQAELQSF